MARPRTDEDSTHKYGEPIKYDPNFRGPTKRRSCTDIICLFLFFVFLVAWIGVAAYAFRYGSADAVVRPFDSEGRKCGFHPDVVDKKYLYFFDLSKCATPAVLLNGCGTPQVCVSECPQTAWSAQDYLDGRKRFDPVDINNNIICKSDTVKTSITSLINLKDSIEREQCASVSLPSQPLQKRCLPSVKHLRQLQSSGLDTKVLSNSALNVKYYTDVEEFGTNVLQDFEKSWPYLLASAGASIVISIVIIVLLRWVAKVVIWLLLLGLLVLSGVGAYFCYARYDYLRKHGPDEVHSRMIYGALESIKQNKNAWLGFGIALTVVFILFLLVVIFLRKRVAIAIALIEEGSKAVGSALTTLFFPVIPLLLQCAVIVWTVTVGVYLSSITTPTFKVHNLNPGCHCTGDYVNIKNNDYCEVDEFHKYCFINNGNCSAATCSYYKDEISSTTVFLILFDVFGLFWGVYFLSGVAQMILSYVFSTWYWTFDKRKVPFFTVTEAAFTVIGNHLGTVAFGSLIIAICAFIRAVLEYIDRKLKKYDNSFTRAILCCLKCFFWCLQKFIQFVSSNAYIMCAIHGKNFCASAVHAFNLLMRNAVRAAVLDGVVYFLFIIGKLVIAGLIGGIAYLAFFNGTPPVLDVNYVSIQLTVMVLTAYIIASVFFDVYSSAINTLFLCFLEDCERNDGSPEKPYYMSKDLMKILGKKNKRG